MNMVISEASMLDALGKMKELANDAEMLRVQVEVKQGKKDTEPKFELTLWAVYHNANLFGFRTNSIDVDIAMDDFKGKLPKPLTPEQLERRAKAQALREQADKIEKGEA